MPYDDPFLKEFGGYFKSPEPGVRERADAWATAIGLQKVDGLEPSQYLLDLAKRHIEGKLTQRQVSRRINDYYSAKDETNPPDPSKEEPDKVSELIVKVINDRERLSENGCQKTVEKLVGFMRDNPEVTQTDMACALSISRQAVQKHIARLKSAGRIRRVGPDNGGHWEVV